MKTKASTFEGHLKDILREIWRTLTKICTLDQPGKRLRLLNDVSMSLKGSFCHATRFMWFVYLNDDKGT